MYPIWGVRQIPVVYVSNPSDTPPGAWLLTVLDDADQANALGFHDELKDGIIYGRVFASPVLDNGGAVLQGQLTVASVLSHEVCEIAVDSRVNLWADSGDALYALEAADPVEDISYDVHVSVGGVLVPVSLSDFVTPAWFDPMSDPNSFFSYKQSVKTPFTLTSGGYCITMTEGKVSQVFGEKREAWRNEAKLSTLSRTARRVR